MKSREQFLMVDKIISRAEQMGIRLTRERITSFIDVELACEKFNMDLEAWLNANDENFSHDYIGIYENVDRVNKDFGLFVPRFAR